MTEGSIDKDADDQDDDYEFRKDFPLFERIGGQIPSALCTFLNIFTQDVDTFFVELGICPGGSPLSVRFCQKSHGLVVSIELANQKKIAEFTLLRDGTIDVNMIPGNIGVFPT